MLAWFVGAHGVLCGRIHQPSDLSRRDKVDVAWNGSDWLRETSPPGIRKAPFFPQANCDAVLRLLLTLMKEEVVLDWWTSIAEDPELDAQVYELPIQFLELYS
jgi:hypothetical protein